MARMVQRRVQGDRKPPEEREITMLLLIVMIALLVLALGGGGLWRSRYGNWSWSPAVLVLLVAAVLFYTGHLSWRG
jgi:hypothetical protein